MSRRWKLNASQALLPPGWQIARDPATGKFYFYNTSTGVGQWEPPGISAAAGGDAVAAGDAAQQAPSILASAIPHIQPSLAGVLAAAVQLPTSMGSVAGLVPAGMTEDEMLQMAINASLRANGVPCLFVSIQCQIVGRSILL